MRVGFISTIVCALCFGGRLFAADCETSYELNGSGAANTTLKVYTSAGLGTAAETINGWTSGRTVSVGGVDVPDSGVFIISLQADLSPCTGGASFTTAGTTTTLLGNGHKILFSNAAGIGNDMYFYVANGAVLSLGVDGDAAASALDITRAASNDTAGPLYAFQNGTIHMYDGVVIHDCVGHNYYGGGATVYGGLLHMHGGVIRNCGIDGGSVCFGGGVASVDGGRFIMDAGTISGCFVQSDYTESSWMTPSTCGGGVLVYGSSSFVMNGGTIENCTADTGHGAGGGVALIASQDSYFNHNAFGWVDSAFVMNGGTIRGCSSAYMGGCVGVYGTYLNVYAIGYDPVVAGMNEFKTAPANATEEEKAAIAAAYAPAPGLWINGGTIADCETANYGGGVFLFRIRPAVHTSIGEATISGCSAEEGGGVAVFNYWTQLAMDGTTVTGNTASHAAGVLLSGNNSGGTIGTTMKDVSVTDNVATGADGVGGIYYETDSKLTISGAMDVSGNVAGSERKDSNLYCQGHSYPFYISGSLEGSTIGLTDPLLDAGGEDSDVFLSSGYDANNPGVHPYDRVFTSDHEGWYADYGDKSVTTTTTSMQETTTTADASTFKYYWYLYAYTPAHDMRYRSILYWDDAHQCLTTTSSGNWGVGQIQVNGKSYIAAYKKSGTTYTIKTLREFDPATLNLTAYPKLADLGLAMDSTIPSERTDAYSGTLSAGRPQETYNITMVEEVTTSTSTPDYSAEVRLVRRRDGVELLAVRQRYPWNNLIDIDYAVTGDITGWTLAFAFTNEATHAVTAPATFLDPADASSAAAPSLATGAHRITWDANADGFALFATNTTWVLTATEGGAVKSVSALPSVALDTRRGVRFVTDPATDILPIAYSTTNWVFGAAGAETTTVIAMPARMEEARRTYHWHDAMSDDAVVNQNGQQTAGDGSYDYEGGNDGIAVAGTQRVHLFEESGEGTNAWHGLCYGLVKLVHSNALGQTTAYFKFRDPTFDVIQRATGDEHGIILADQWLDDFGLNRIDVTPEEVDAVHTELNTVQPNGCRLWENMVLGNVRTNLLVATVPATEPDRLDLGLPTVSPVAGYGYHVLFQLRRAKGGWGNTVQQELDPAALFIDLHPDEFDDVNTPTGLYRIYSLIVPDTRLSVTNEIPSTNIVGVLKVASALTNTVTAVPWTALAGDPAHSTNVAVSAALHLANLSAGDELLAYDSASGEYHGWTRGSDGSWDAMTVVDRDGVRVTPAADDFRLAPGTAFWVVRATPKVPAGVRPYFLYGQYLPGDYAATIKGGSKSAPSSTLCANPTSNVVALAEVVFEGGIGKDDTIAFNTDGSVSTIYVRNAANTEWGYHKKSVSRGRVVSTWVTARDIAPGTGFWYIRRASGDLTVKWPGWTE